VLKDTIFSSIEKKERNKQTRKQQQTFQCFEAARSSAHSKNKQENSNES